MFNWEKQVFKIDVFKGLGLFWLIICFSHLFFQHHYLLVRAQFFDLILISGFGVGAYAMFHFFPFLVEQRMKNRMPEMRLDRMLKVSIVQSGIMKIILPVFILFILHDILFEATGNFNY